MMLTGSTAGFDVGHAQVQPVTTKLTSWQVSVFNVYKIICQTSNKNHTKSQNLNVSHLILQLFLLNPWKPGVSLRMNPVHDTDSLI